MFSFHIMYDWTTSVYSYFHENMCYTPYMVTALYNVVMLSIERVTVIVSLYTVTDNSVLLLGAWLILAAAREIIFGKA